MSLQSIEIICRPCGKCREMERRIKEAIKALEKTHNATYRYEMRKSVDLRRAQRYGANIAQTPFVIINGVLEFVGGSAMPNVEMIKGKILDIVRS